MGLKSDVPEVAKRCEMILRTVAKTVNDETYEDRTVDIITTTDLTILRGKLETTSIKVRTKSLGELTVQLADVKCLGKPAMKEERRQQTPATTYTQPGRPFQPLPVPIAPLKK